MNNDNKTNPNDLVSKKISDIRDRLFYIRSEIEDLIRTKPKQQETDYETRLITPVSNDERSLQDIVGTLTSAGVYMHSIMNERFKYERHIVKSFFPDSLELNPRGIGKDIVPCCFCCGDTYSDLYMHNIASYVSSREQGDKIAALFKTVTGHDCVKVDFRDHEPNYIQVKFGVCQKHQKSLFDLHALMSKLNLVNSDMISKVCGG